MLFSKTKLPRIPILHEYTQKMRRQASILLFFTAGLFLFSSCNDSSTSDLQNSLGASVAGTNANLQLYGTYFQQVDLTTRGGGKDKERGAEDRLDAVLEAGFEAYKAEDYELAISHFKNFAAEKPSNRQVPYYISLSYLALEEVDEAQPYLEQLLSMPDALYYEHAQWYMALVHLHRKELDACAQYLEQIIQVDWHYFNERARSLLEQVKYLQEHGKS